VQLPLAYFQARRVADSVALDPTAKHMSESIEGR
jgi:hypothetical protein